MKTLAEQIVIMQAALDGKIIQVRRSSGVQTEWYPKQPTGFDWNGFDYRVKPEPRAPRSVFVVENAEVGNTAVFDTEEAARKRIALTPHKPLIYAANVIVEYVEVIKPE